MMTDVISDMLTRIRNGYQAHHAKVPAFYSKINEGIAKILIENKFLKGYEIKEENSKKTLYLELLYRGQRPAISRIKRVSKPGCRIYLRSGKITPVLSKFGLSIISTSAGLLTDDQARQQKVGGELICQVW